MYDYDKRYTYVIANVPYSRVDHYYSTVDDLLKVFEALDEYTAMTNEQLENFYDSRDLIKDILVIVDEAHLYLGARESLTKSSILNKLKLIFTQCRKRKIRIVFITQRLTQIDIYVRRLSDYVEEYEISHFLWLEIDKKNVYLNKWDVVDIETDQTVKYTNEWDIQTIKDELLIHSEYFAPLTTFLQYFALLFDKGYRRIIKEEYQTYHVCWNPDPRVKEFNREILMKWLVITPTKEELEKIKKKMENKWKKWYEIYFPTITKNIKLFYSIVKWKVMSLFRPWYEDINFQELYNEAENEESLQEKLNTVEKDIQSKVKSEDVIKSQEDKKQKILVLN